MRHIKFVSMLLMAIMLASCGGGNSDVPAKPKFTSLITFGDSLSDVGSYKVGVVAGVGGGQFTINIPSTPTNWTEMVAPQLGLAAPCAYETGLDNGSGAAPGSPAGTVVDPVFNTSCTSYAQGGARVTSQPGIGNKLLGGGGFALTVPVVTQISNHLTAHGGTFSGNDIVFVMAGANDVFYQAAVFNNTVGAGGDPTAALNAAVLAVQTAATELANDVSTQIVGSGAKYVVVINVPDISSTPYVTSIADPTAKAQTKGLFDALVSAFNTQLKTDLPDSANVLNVDAFTASQDEVAHKDKYNLTNVTETACDLTAPSPNAFGSSLACNAADLNTAFDSSLTTSSHYLFADTVHPTPYGHSLFALYVLQAMTNKGWY